MNAIYILISLLALVFLLNCATSKTKEGFRGRHRRRRFWDGPQAYLYRFRRRRPFPGRYFWNYDWGYDPGYGYDYD